ESKAYRPLSSIPESHHRCLRRWRRGLRAEHGEPPRPNATDQRAGRARSRRAVAYELSAVGHRAEFVAQSQIAEQAHEAIERQSHHGEVIAVDSFDDRGTIALDAVRARLVHRLSGVDVALDLVGVELAKRDAHLLDGR